MRSSCQWLHLCWLNVLLVECCTILCFYFININWMFLRLTFLQFFASVLSGYRDFVVSQVSLVCWYHSAACLSFSPDLWLTKSIKYFLTVIVYLSKPVCVQDSTVGTANPFNAVAFLRKRSRIMGCSDEPMVCLIKHNKKIECSLLLSWSTANFAIIWIRPINC